MVEAGGSTEDLISKRKDRLTALEILGEKHSTAPTKLIEPFDCMQTSAPRWSK